MVRIIILLLAMTWGHFSFAKTNSYFTLTGDRAMINIRSGHPLTPNPDDDANRLYAGMNVIPENSIMGKGKKIQMKEALTLIVADRGKGQFDGTVMIYQSPGVHLDSSRKIVDVAWTGEDAAVLFSKFNSTNGIFEYNSADGRLKIFTDPNHFQLSYREWERSED